MSSPCVIRKADADNNYITMTIYHRDQCPEAIEYLWKVEILNNWQKYWDPMNRSLHLD
jgi:hypothetical protein